MDTFNPDRVMRVKICGITNIADAVCACQAGADLLGFVFYPPSSRYLPPANARRLIGELQEQEGFQSGHVRTVGLCVGLSPEELARTASQAGVDLLQIYGTYSPAVLRNLPVSIFKSIRPASEEAALAEGSAVRSFGWPGRPAVAGRCL